MNAGSLRGREITGQIVLLHLRWLRLEKKGLVEVVRQ